MNIREQTTVDFLRRVFCYREKLSANLPQLKRPDGCVIRGEIKSPLARRVVAFVEMIGNEIVELELSGSDPDDYGIRLRALLNVLQAIFWQIVIEEHPITAFHRVALTEDWHFYGIDNWFDIDLPNDLRRTSFFNFTKRLSAILSGNRQYLRDPAFKDQELGEQVLLTVDDESSRGLFCLSYEIKHEVPILKKEITTSLAKQEFLSWEKNFLAQFTIQGCIIRLINAMEMLNSLILFDLSPETQNADLVSVRKGWKVVANVNPESN